MKKIFSTIYVGGKEDAFYDQREDWVVIHCAKTAHQKALGYTGNLKPDHPNYLVYKDENHIYINMVDMEKEFLDKFTMPMIKAAIPFAERAFADGKNILFHCDQGESRAPSMALLLLARLKIVDRNNYYLAKEQLANVYPPFKPNTGIDLYLSKRWPSLATGDI